MQAGRTGARALPAAAGRPQLQEGRTHRTESIAFHQTPPTPHARRATLFAAARQFDHLGARPHDLREYRLSSHQLMPAAPLPEHTQVEFLSSSEEINKRPDEYWTLVMDIARKNNLKRIVR